MQQKAFNFPYPCPSSKKGGQGYGFRVIGSWLWGHGYGGMGHADGKIVSHILTNGAGFSASFPALYAEGCWLDSHKYVGGEQTAAGYFPYLLGTMPYFALKHLLKYDGSWMPTL